MNPATNVHGFPSDVSNGGKINARVTKSGLDFAGRDTFCFCFTFDCARE